MTPAVSDIIEQARLAAQAFVEFGGSLFNPTVRLGVTGLALLFGIQAAINMMVNLHMTPAKGMTLPFISYGGSSLISLALGMGFLIALTRKRPRVTMLSQKPPGTAPATIAGVMR